MPARPLATLCFRLTAVLAAASLLSVQLAAQTPTITVPSGTVIPATLVSPIHTLSTKVGDAIRAQVAFPITVGTQLAIPAGTFIEGTLEPGASASKKDKHPAPVMHFTRLVFADGSTAALDASPQAALGKAPLQAAPTDTLNASDDTSFIPTGHGGGSLFAPTAPMQQTGTQTQNPFAHAGPNPAVIYGPLIAIVAFVLFFVFHGHSNKNVDSVRYSVGYQFQLVLNAPLTVDSAHVNASAAMPVR